MLTTNNILAIAPQAHDPVALAPALDAAAAKYKITPGNRLNMWLAQLAHESAGFTRFKENLNYSANGLLKTFPNYFRTKAHAEAYANRPEQIANRVYADRLGNGGELSGDGWKYRGHGLIQLTGKDNYREYGGEIGVDLINFPDKASEVWYAAMIAGAFWDKRHCNEMADKGDFRGITRAINGGLNGFDDRKHWLKRVERILV